MRIAALVMMTSALMIFGGCQTNGMRGGGAARDEGFRVVVPQGRTQIKQGETQSVRVWLERGMSFKRDVKLAISSSEGITIRPDSVVIRASDRPEAQLQVTAADDAAIGTYYISINATPATGESTSATFNVDIVSP